MAIWTLFVFRTDAQDVQFSQYLAVPQHLNPALTGNIDGLYRVMGVYRDQNRNVFDPPLQTFGFGGDVKFELGAPSVKSDNQFGIGVFFYSDKAPTFQFNTNSVHLNLAYHRRIGLAKNDLLSLGFLVGVQQQNINYDNLNFGDEFNAIDAYDRPTSEVLPPNNFGYGDVGVGLAYSSTIGNQNGFQLGLALQHLNRPYRSYYRLAEFVDPQLNVDFRLPMKLTAHLGLDLQTVDFVYLQPRIIYIQQGDQSRISLGGNIKFDFVKSQSSFLVGAWIRAVKDVDGLKPRYVVPMIGLNKGSFQFGLSYDVNTFVNMGYASNLNALEFTMQFIGSFENDDYFCPSF